MSAKRRIRRSVVFRRHEAENVLDALANAEARDRFSQDLAWLRESIGRATERAIAMRFINGEDQE